MNLVTGFLTAIKLRVLSMGRHKAALLLSLISYPSFVLSLAAILSMFRGTLPLGTTLPMLVGGLSVILLVFWLLTED